MNVENDCWHVVVMIFLLFSKFFILSLKLMKIIINVDK